MALQSALFRDDPRLEAAAVSNPAHIIPGARGDHVRKIQLALMVLDGAGITPDGMYGAATAAAVLAYKKKRDIVNRSYQTQPDNIVGKMTMASLDGELHKAESTPVLLLPVDPLPRFTIPLPERELLALNGPGVMGVTDLPAIPIHPPSAPGSALQRFEVIITPGHSGWIRVLSGAGGKLVRTQNMGSYGRGKNGFQVAKLGGAATANKDVEEADVKSNDSTFTYDALYCGETFFQARVATTTPPQKVSHLMHLLCLVDKSVTLPVQRGDYSPDPAFKSGLVSREGTPLKPLPGRRINIFGEGESAGFEDYSSDIDFCSHTFSGSNGPPGVLAGHRPWTADPRKATGIAPKSVTNICCRSSPIAPVTISEILRIGVGKCRVTYAEASGRTNSERLRAGLKGARVIDEGPWKGDGYAIVFELA